MIKFTEPNGEHVYVRSDSIVRVLKSPDKGNARLDLINGQFQYVTESREHVIALIDDAEFE